MSATDRQGPDRYSATPIDPAKYRDEYEVERTRLLEEMIPSGPGRAIDVGCGPGHFTAKLAEKGWQTTAIDTDPSNLDRARVHAAETHLGDAISVLGGLAAGSYDLACAFEIIEQANGPGRRRNDGRLRRVAGRCDGRVLDGRRDRRSALPAMVEGVQ